MAGLITPHLGGGATGKVLPTRNRKDDVMNMIDREIKRLDLYRDCVHVLSDVAINDPAQKGHILKPFHSNTQNKTYYPCVKCGVFCPKPKEN
jgi:hypothetical protein